MGNIITVDKDRTTTVSQDVEELGSDRQMHKYRRSTELLPDGNTVITRTITDISEVTGYPVDYPGKEDDQEPVTFNRGEDASEEDKNTKKKYAKTLDSADQEILNNYSDKEVMKAETQGVGQVWYTKTSVGNVKSGSYSASINKNQEKEAVTPILSTTDDPGVIEGAAYVRTKQKEGLSADSATDAYFKAKEEKAAARSERENARALEAAKQDGSIVGIGSMTAAEQSAVLRGEKLPVTPTPEPAPSPDLTDTETAPQDEEVDPIETGIIEAHKAAADTMQSEFQDKKDQMEADFEADLAQNKAEMDAVDLVNIEKNFVETPVDAALSTGEIDYAAKYGDLGYDINNYDKAAYEQRKIDDAATTDARQQELSDASTADDSPLKQEPTTREGMNNALDEERKVIKIKKVNIYPTVAAGTPQTPPNSPGNRGADYYRNGKFYGSGDARGYEVRPREFLPIDVKDSPASIRVYGRGKGDGEQLGEMRDLIPAYSKFIVEAVSESRTERSQIVETFGDFYVFMFGERPSVQNFSCQLINGSNINWVHDFMFMYDTYLRGTRCVEQNASALVTYGGKQISGLITNCSAQINAAVEGAVAMSFSVIVFERNYFFYSPDVGVYTNASGDYLQDGNLTKLLDTIANPEGRGTSDANVSAANAAVKQIMNKKKSPKGLMAGESGLSVTGLA